MSAIQQTGMSALRWATHPITRSDSFPAGELSCSVPGSRDSGSFAVEAPTHYFGQLFRGVRLGQEIDAFLECALVADRARAIPGGINHLELRIGAFEFFDEVGTHHTAGHHHVGEQ